MSYSLSKQAIIHSLNKNEVALPNNVKELISEKTNVILLCNLISNIKIASEENKKQ